MKPGPVRTVRSSRLRSCAFSSTSPERVRLSSASESRSEATARKRVRLVRPSAARSCSHTNGASAVVRRPAATVMPQLAGISSARAESSMHPANSHVSRRDSQRSVTRAIWTQAERTLRNFSKSSRIRPVPRTTQVSGSSST